MGHRQLRSARKQQQRPPLGTMRDPPIGSMPRDELESRIIAQVAMFSLN